MSKKALLSCEGEAEENTLVALNKYFPFPVINTTIKPNENLLFIKTMLESPSTATTNCKEEKLVLLNKNNPAHSKFPEEQYALYRLMDTTTILIYLKLDSKLKALNYVSSNVFFKIYKENPFAKIIDGHYEIDNSAIKLLEEVGYKKPVVEEHEHLDLSLFSEHIKIQSFKESLNEHQRRVLSWMKSIEDGKYLKNEAIFYNL